MMLSPQNVIHYLLDNKLLAFEDVADGDVVVVDSSRRNRNFKVKRGEAAGLFVKQIQTWEPQTTSSLRREAICYWMAAKEPPFSSLRQVMPAYRHYDPARSVLVTDLLANGESLAEYHQRSGTFCPDLGAELGRALGLYHGLPVTNITTSAYRGAFSRAVPWILSFHEQAPGGFNLLSAGNSQMLAVLRQYPDFQKHLNALRTEWQSDTLMHGDMKWDNCFIETGADGRRTLRVVDWELADIGDAAWDIGAVFQSYLSFWVFSLPLELGTSLDQLLGRTRFPLEAMQPAMTQFWKTYQGARPEAERVDPALLSRSIRSAAARMIQTVYEYMHRSPQLTGNALCLLQLSLNILNRPLEAQKELLDL